MNEKSTSDEWREKGEGVSENRRGKYMVRSEEYEISREMSSEATENM